MSNNRNEKLKFIGWGSAIGAVVAIILGFTWGGWVTASTAGKIRTEAVLDTQSAICAAQFMKSPNHKAKVKAFKEYESWRRHEYIEEGGWDKMPGDDIARVLVSNACAEAVETLLEK